MNPMLASDLVLDKLKFPLIAQPKIDGVRGWAPTGQLVARTLKPFKNKSVHAFFNHSLLRGFDGELTALEPTDHALCRATSSALSSHNTHPVIRWWMFDYVADRMINAPYVERYAAMLDAMDVMWSAEGVAHEIANRLRIVEYKLVHTREELLALDDVHIDEGYEGTIVRDPNGVHKAGRSTVREGGLLRLKRFVEEDAIVEVIEEGQTNLNEATVNALGQTERSTHQANMVPNGMVGSFGCIDAKTGKRITVGAGKLSHAERKHIWEHPKLYLGRTLKYKKFLIGEKDKPRFPTFQDWRMDEDKVEG